MIQGKVKTHGWQVHKGCSNAQEGRQGAGKQIREMWEDGLGTGAATLGALMYNRAGPAGAAAMPAAGLKLQAAGWGCAAGAAAAATLRLLGAPQVHRHLGRDFYCGLHGGVVRGVQRLVVRRRLQAKHLGGQHPAGKGGENRV